MDVKKIVITGGPGTGKTSVINKLETSGFYCFHEIVRDMTLDAKKEAGTSSFESNPLAFVKDPKSFNDQLLSGRKEHYIKAAALNEEVVFFDRGIPDVLAYMDYFNQPYESDYLEVCKNYRYDIVFLLPPWKEIYIQDNERMESFNEAVEIHDALEKTYSSLDYFVIEVPFGTFNQRLRFILDYIGKSDA